MVTAQKQRKSWNCCNINTLRFWHGCCYNNGRLNGSAGIKITGFLAGDPGKTHAKPPNMAGIINKRIGKENQMKRNIIKIMVCALVVAFAFTGFAMASEAGKKEAAPAVQEKTAEAKPPATEKAVEPAKEVTVSGTVEKTETGIVIKTADAVYTVAGKDLAEMVGKNVDATGTVDGKTIKVAEVKEAEKK